MQKLIRQALIVAYCIISPLTFEIEKASGSRRFFSTYGQVGFVDAVHKKDGDNSQSRFFPGFGGFLIRAICRFCDCQLHFCKPY